MEEKEERIKLLIADDDSSSLMELIHILQPEYRIYSVKDGMSALKKAEMSLPDIILLDVIMPNMSGFEVITELKKSDKTKNIPVIFITGDGIDSSESMGLSLGAADYIRKPFDPTVEKLRIRNQIHNINTQNEKEETNA